MQQRYFDTWITANLHLTQLANFNWTQWPQNVTIPLIYCNFLRGIEFVLVDFIGGRKGKKLIQKNFYI